MEMNTKAKTEKQDKMPWGRFFAWKTRDVALAAVTVILSSYLLLYCANTLGLDTAVVGILLLVARIVDAFTDVAAGFIVDSTKTKFGKARPYEIFIVLEWICMVALFFANENWSMFFKYAYVFIMYVLIFSICSTMLNAAQNPYMIRAFNGKRSIVTKVSSFGGIVTLAGSIIVSMTFPRLYNAWVIEGNGGSAAWRKLIIVYAIPLALLGIIRFLAVKEDPAIDDAEKDTQKLNLKEVFTMLRTNPYVWSFGGMIGLYNLAVGFGAGSFYFQYVVGNVNAFGAVSAFGMILLPIMIIFPTLIKKMGMSKLFIIAAAGSVLGYVTVFFGGGSLAIVYVGIIVTNLISLPCSYLQTPGIMNIATYNEYKGMHRMDGSSAIVMNFLMKSLAGVGTGLTGVLLSMAGYISTTGSEIVAQPDSAIFMIRLLYSLIPGLCVAGIILCSLHYIKLEKQIPQIEAEIKARKEAGQK